MAGDWIKIEHATVDKPEVFQIAELLGVDPDTVVGKLVRIWVWADVQTLNGNAVTVTTATIDRIAYLSGFAAALIKVGWLIVRRSNDSESLQFPNFDRHNGQTAKNRAVTNRRVAKHRQQGNADGVTDVTHPPLPKPLPEKRREEDIELERNTEGASAGCRRPTLPQAIAAASEIGVTDAKASEWWHTREASEWIKGTAGGGTTAVGSNWRADLKTFAARNGFGHPPQHHRAAKAAAEYPEPTKLTIPIL